MSREICYNKAATFRAVLAGMIALATGGAVAGPWVKYGDKPVLGDTRLGT